MAFGEGRGTLRVVGVGEGSVLGGGDHGFVGIAVGEVDVGFLLEGGVEPAVVDSQGDELDVLTLDFAGRDRCVLAFEVIGEFGAIMPAVAFGEDSEVAVLVLRELRVEGLEQRPDVWGGCYGGGDFIVAIGETSPDWLVDIEHVCELVEGIGV